jgi:hypothetical protein
MPKANAGNTGWPIVRSSLAGRGWRSSRTISAARAAALALFTTRRFVLYAEFGTLILGRGVICLELGPFMGRRAVTGGFGLFRLPPRQGMLLRLFHLGQEGALLSGGAGFCRKLVAVFLARAVIIVAESEVSEPLPDHATC